MPTFKSGAFAQQCYSSHPSSLTVKTLILFTPAIAPTIPPTRPEAAKTASFPVGSPPLPHPPGIAPAHPESAKTDPFPGGPAKTGSLPGDAPLPGGPAETAPLPGGTGAVSLYRLVVSCDNCGMRHRFVIETLTSRLGQEESLDPKAMSQLSRCVAEHPADLRVSNMDVVSDSVRLMCRDCRRTYDLGVSTVETYQK
jgi:RNase P subunit RPR2